MEIDFLTIDDVLEIHADQILRYGGESSIGDRNMLESALAMPPAMFADQFLHEDIFQMAAAYMFHLVQNHPFVDGNKRTGTVAAIVFLEINDIEVDVDNETLEEFVLAIARGEKQKNEIAEFLRLYSS